MKRTLSLTIVLVVIAFIPVSATIIHIPDDYPTIQEGIGASSDGDTVLVQPGMYIENIKFNGHNIVLGSLFLNTGDTLYISATIINGGDAGTVVTFENGEDSTAVIIGFTVQNGYGGAGAGISCSNSNPKISNNTISGNVADGGAGIYCTYSNPRIVNNSITNNFSTFGGGIFCFINSNPDIFNNSIVGNEGGGIYCWNNANATITNNTIKGNCYGFYGGGISCMTSDPIISNNIIIGNLDLAGGAIYCSHSNSIISNNTINDNYAEYGGGIYCSHSSPLIINTIFWSDTAVIGNEIYAHDSSPVITYCDIQGGWEGEGNIDVDPLFRDQENSDLHLMSIECGDPEDSPCIDAGHPDILDSLLDCDWGLGELRSDMGAYGGGDSVQVVIDDKEPELSSRFALSQNYPNPFNVATNICFNLYKSSEVTLEIFDILGRKVQTQNLGMLDSGSHNITWNGSDFASGMYFYKLTAGNVIDIKKMTILK